MKLSSRGDDSRRGDLRLNAGFVALVANLAVFVVVSVLTYDANSGKNTTLVHNA